MNGKLSLSSKVDTNKSQISVNPVNNINVKVLGTETVATADIGIASGSDGSFVTDTQSRDLMVEYPTDEKVLINKLMAENEALKIIIEMQRDNPILVNKLILADDVKLEMLIKLLTNADEVHIDADDVGSGCTGNKYRKVNAIYVIKDGNTKNLKYDYPDITKELKDLGIQTKFVW